jgi:hypothetical protein
MMKAIIIVFIFLLITPKQIFAQDCTRLTQKEKIFLKIDSIKDVIYSFMLMDFNMQIDFQLHRANSLYKTASNSPNPNYAYAVSLRAENYITRIPQLLQRLKSTESFDVNAYEKLYLEHKEVIAHMKSNCDWITISGFIDRNHDTIRKIYFLNLPTDQNLQLY